MTNKIGDFSIGKFLMLFLIFYRLGTFYFFISTHHRIQGLHYLSTLIPKSNTYYEYSCLYSPFFTPLEKSFKIVLRRGFQFFRFGQKSSGVEFSAGNFRRCKNNHSFSLIILSFSLIFLSGS